MILRWNDGTTLPVECPEGLTPDRLLARSTVELSKLPVHIGNKVGELGDLFSVGEDGRDALTFEGDLSHVRGLGRGMKKGHLIIRGIAGPELAAEMEDGMVTVHGDVGDQAGVGMRGGWLKVGGNAGFDLGGAVAGARLGMREGVIVVEGDAKDRIGRKMRRGLIVVRGDVGEGCGMGMIAGSILAFGKMGRYAGMGMKRGTIAAIGTHHPELLPTFASAGRYRFPFLSIYLRWLMERGIPVPRDVLSAEWTRYNGDLADGGQGEILVVNGPGGS